MSKVQNGDLESFQKTPKGTCRAYWHSVMTYANEKQLKRVLATHLKSIIAYCYIKHDKDESETHFHILLHLYNASYTSTVERWFAGLKDSKKEFINTFSQKITDIEVMKLYLTHSDPESVKLGKHRYPESAIHDFGVFSEIIRTDAKDNVAEIVDKLILGVPLRELVKRYGRDFLYHYNQYVTVAQDIILQEEKARVNSALNTYELQKIKELKK